MDPFFTVWIVGGILTFIAGYALSIAEDDTELIGVGFAAGALFPVLVLIGAIMLAGWLITLPHQLIRNMINRKELERQKFKSLDAELDKQIEETRKLIG